MCVFSCATLFYWNYVRKTVRRKEGSTASSESCTSFANSMCLGISILSIFGHERKTEVSVKLIDFIVHQVYLLGKAQRYSHDRALVSIYHVPFRITPGRTLFY